MSTTVEDVLHIHGGHDGGGDGEVTDQLGPLHLPRVAQEPRLHPVEVLADAQLHGSKVDVGFLLDPCHPHVLMASIRRTS